ncbi:MAG: hypothetical protein KH230_16955 [Enterocloster asparagiformis]|nr:hypothetical protein [Enterocloster asparagiformis]
MSNNEAIKILQEHIATYHHQLTDGGWEQMVNAGIVRNNVYEKLAYRADAQRHIEAYEMAIKALANGEIEERCFLGAPCRFQTPV